MLLLQKKYHQDFYIANLQIITTDKNISNFLTYACKTLNISRFSKFIFSPVDVFKNVPEMSLGLTSHDLDIMITQERMRQSLLNTKCLINMLKKRGGVYEKLIELF